MKNLPPLIGIVAMTSERIIGLDGGLPWHLPEDLAFFKHTTLNHPILMGRKTFDSIGRSLPKRTNIVLTRDTHWIGDENSVTITHLDELHKFDLDTQKPIFIIGGAQIYTNLLEQLDGLYVSLVKENHPGDTRFPEFEASFSHKKLVEDFADFTVYYYSK